MKYRAKFASVIVALSLVACAGTPIDWDQARKIQPGMTEQQVLELLGKPYMVRSAAEGQTWIWSHANTLTGDVRSLSIVMKDGVVERAPSVPSFYK